MTTLKSKIGTPWFAKRKIRNRKVSRSIKPAIVKDLDKSVLFAGQIGLELNLFITIKHYDIDDISPEDRKKRSERDLNRLNQFARDNQFKTAFIWSRESQRGTGLGEHLHVLMHVPSNLKENLKDVIGNWGGDVYVRDDNAGIRRFSSLKTGSTSRYILKNSPGAAYGKSSRLYRLGGPILGKRCGCSRNIDRKAQEVWKSSSLANRTAFSSAQCAAYWQYGPSRSPAGLDTSPVEGNSNPSH